MITEKPIEKEPTPTTTGEIFITTTMPKKNGSMLKEIGEVETSRGIKCGSQATSGSRKKYKGSKKAGQEVLTLTKDDIHEIYNTIMFATKDC